MPYAWALTTAVTPWRGSAAAWSARTLFAMASRSTSIQQSTFSILTAIIWGPDGHATDRILQPIAAQGRQRRRGVLALVRHGHPPLGAGGLLRAGWRHHGYSPVRLQPLGKHAGGT